MERKKRQKQRNQKSYKLNFMDINCSYIFTNKFCVWNMAHFMDYIYNSSVNRKYNKFNI